MIAASNCILLLFLGLVYAWSVLKKPLAEAFAWNDNELTMCFTICMSFFCFGSLLAAKLTKKVRHRTVVLGAGTAVLAAFLLASRMNSLWQLYLTYGVVVGFCVGAVYNCVLSTGNAWFKGRNGLMTGLYLMCFGAGSLLLGPLITALMAYVGWSRTFVILGVLFFIVFVFMSPQVCMPESNQRAASAKCDIQLADISFCTKEMVKHTGFWYYLLWSTILSAVGLALVGQAATIAGTFGFSSMQASLTVSMVSASNGIGRLIFGSIYNKKGRKLTMGIIALSSILGTLMLLCSVLWEASALLIAAFVFMSFGYGGITPTNSNFIRDFYGPDHYPVNFSLINFNLLVSSFLGQYIGSSLYLSTGSYAVPAAVMLLICTAGFGIDFILKRPVKMDLSM